MSEKHDSLPDDFPESEQEVTLSDRELFLRYRDMGEEHGFALFVRRYHKKLVNVAWRILRDEDDAEDAAQEAWVKMVKYRMSFNADKNFKTWIGHIIRTAALDVLRKKNARGKNAKPVIHSLSGISHLPDGNDPTEDVQRTENKVAIHDAINRLPEDRRMPLLAVHIGGRTTDDLAEQLHTSVHVVRHRIRQGIQDLRKDEQLSSQLLIVA